MVSMDLDSLWAVLVHFNPKQTYRVMAAPSQCFSNTSLDSNRYEAWKDHRSSICWYFMIYVNNLRARNWGTDDTLGKLYLYISCNNIYRVPRKKRKERERHRALSSDSCTRSCSATAGPTKGTEHGAIQRGSVHSTVSIVSVTCLLCIT